MRLLPAVFCVILAGAMIGAGAVAWRVWQARWDGKPVEVAQGQAAAKPSPPDDHSPKVAVDHEEYDFGVMNLGAELSHDFIFTNTGRSPLVLTPGPTSCQCTVSEIRQGEAPPGGSTKVTLHWKAREVVGEYRQTATIHTNDPARPEVQLAVSGRVAAAVWADPSELVLGQLSRDEPATARTQLLCSQSPRLEILDYKFSDENLAKFFQVTLKPLAKAELPVRSDVRSGVLLTVAVKPGLPQGAFQQTILLRTNLASAPALSVSVEGAVGGDITVAGRGWDPESGILTLGIVSSKSGTERRLILVAHGPQCREVKFKPVRIEPGSLTAAVGEPSLIAGGATSETPLVIRIPPGSRPANHLGADQGELGEIVLETNHPRTPRLRIMVRFLIERE